MKQYFGLPGIKEGDLLQRRMDGTFWIVIDLYFDHALFQSSTTGNNRWVFREDWRNYDEAR
jgi:hypothetical protein